MQNLPNQQKINPLHGLMRQPKIYVRLPSGGRYWPEGSLTVTPTGEYPVYSMTAKDELILKTPDALLNGQAVVDVFQSCVPNIVDAWGAPSLDVDSLLIAIRLATYGEMLDTTVTVAGIDAEYPVDLRSLLDQLNNNITWEERIDINENLTVYVKPLPYKFITKASVETFETQRIMNLVNDDSLDEEKKLSMFRDSFNKLTKINIGSIVNSIYRIDVAGSGSVTEPNFIEEFIENCDREIYNKIKTHLDNLTEKNTAKPIKVKATQEMIDAGSAEEIEVPLTFDSANFFG